MGLKNPARQDQKLIVFFFIYCLICPPCPVVALAKEDLPLSYNDKKVLGWPAQQHE